ncbi:hypothetical protein V6N13_053001 [Hibiscus sabdariffa]|uniref:Uncharacterized protein n=1 Tax=Hibiscus sabdariffa TaxID=183260 RepID=A0ABR2Q6A4_9ROSI
MSTVYHRWSLCQKLRFSGVGATNETVIHASRNCGVAREVLHLSGLDRAVIDDSNDSGKAWLEAFTQVRSQVLDRDQFIKIAAEPGFLYNEIRIKFFSELVAHSMQLLMAGLQ